MISTSYENYVFQFHFLNVISFLMHFFFFRDVIDKLCSMIERSGNVDAWWTTPVETLLKDKSLASQYEKGTVSNLKKSMSGIVVMKV